VQLIETAPHEFAAHFLYTRHGLDPFFACDRLIKEGDGSQPTTFEHEDETWSVTLSYRDSGLQHPGDTLPSGTEFQLESMREFDLNVSSEDDPIGERSFHAHIAPRWQGMRSKKGTEISIPDDLSEGINVHIQGSNIEFEQYQTLLQRAARSLKISPDYFASRHEFSTILDAERYVRVHEGASGPIHARDGPLAQLGHLLENDRQGRRKLVQFDDDERGRSVPGYYHTATLGPRRIQEAFPSHEAPKEIKHYYAQEAAGHDEDQALAHPKVGVSYQKSFWRESVDATPESMQRLIEELEETLISVLADANIPIRPGTGTYVEDPYFEATESRRDRDVIELDLTRIEHRQESVVIKHIADGLAPTDWDTLRVLVSDGGEVSPKEIADEADRHPGSVYRALDRLSDMVEHEYGKVSLRSTYIAELVHDAVREAKEATRRAAEAGAKAMEAAERGINESTSVFIAWAAKHDIEVRDRSDASPLELEFGTVDEIRRILREGLELWKQADLPEERYRMARVRFEKEAESGLKSIDKTETKNFATRAWKVLR